MERLDNAILFATKAHDGQRRKTDNVAMIFHPFTVGMILQRAGMSEDTVIAGILHDVAEDTKYKLEDIENYFGEKVRKIVEEVTENKSLEWKQRKTEAIEKIKNASFEGKMVATVDKINNLETLYDLINEKGEEIWNCFNKPYPEQKWYYAEMYQSILENIQENELTQRYKRILEKVFNK